MKSQKQSAGKTPPKKKKIRDWKWIFFVFILTVCISGTFSALASALLDGASVAIAFIILFVIILTGILFDIIGVAVSVADEKPFHSMSAKKVPGAADAIRLIRVADRVSSICNDVIGDICGVISGAASATIAVKVLTGKSANPFVELLLSALVAALTVGGKAFGKTFAIHMSTPIVQTTARILTFFRTLPEKLTKKKKKAS